MILSNGNNNFTDNEFDICEWSAPILQTPEEVIKKIHELKLINRTVKDIYAVGYGYNWNYDEIFYHVSCEMARMNKEERSNLKNRYAFLPEGVFINKWAEIDDPILIEFEDGDVLCLNFNISGAVQMELNTIPKGMKSWRECNFHANKLFGDIIGMEIELVNVTATVCGDRCIHEIKEMENQLSYTDTLSFRFRSKNTPFERINLEFTTWIDYGQVFLKDYYGNAIKIHAPDIKDVVKGYIDEELLDGNTERVFDKEN